MTKPQDNRRRSYWLKTLHEWHWVSSAMCLIGMLLFAVTGFTLNHAGQIEVKPRVVSQQATVPGALLATVKAAPPPPKDRGRCPLRCRTGRARSGRWTRRTARPSGRPTKSMSRCRARRRCLVACEPGRRRGRVRAHRPRLDLLPQRPAQGPQHGAAWSWFIDIFAAACLVFTVTGLFILKMHAGNRPFTWPMVGMGLVIPVVLALLFIH